MNNDMIEFDNRDEFLDYIRKANPQKRRNKYNAQKVNADGYTFDSGAESRRYLYLKSEQDAGNISGLNVHPRFLIVEGYMNNKGVKIKPTYYVADFSYTDMDTGMSIVEDVKSKITKEINLFKLKRKLFEKRYSNMDFRVIDEV